MSRDTGIANRLRAAGLTVVEVDGWQTRGAATLVPRGGVDHHTAGSNTGNAPSLGVCINGRSDLPGPLCNVLQGFDGTCYVIASGRANHAGAGGWKGLSGNSSVYGVERENDGHSPQRPGQQANAERIWAALFTGGPSGTINATMLAGHLEWAPKRKIDFHDVNYPQMRVNVAKLMGSAPPAPAPAPPPTPTPAGTTTPPEGVDMYIAVVGTGFFAQVGNVTIPLVGATLQDFAGWAGQPHSAPTLTIPASCAADFAQKTMLQTVAATK